MGRRGRIALAAALALGLTAAVLTLRSGVRPTGPVTAPDGTRITAFHERFVTPPRSPRDRPPRPGRLRTDPRRSGVLVSWPPAPYGFEVRWGAGGTSTARRYLSGSGISLDRLRPGRYHVEVRTVDEFGQRSDPTSTDVEVSDAAPDWERGLGFLEDFTAGADLDRDRWRIAGSPGECLRRQGDPGPLLVDGQCWEPLLPSSKLTLTAGSGRLVVLADVPPPVLDSPEPRAADDLLIMVGSVLRYGGDGVSLRIGGDGCHLSYGAGGGPQEWAEARLDPQCAGSPGTLDRWELVFAGGRLSVLRNGDEMGSTEFHPGWSDAEVAVSTVSSGRAPGLGVRIGLIGLTGPAPDGRPTDLSWIGPTDQDGPSPEHRLPIAAQPTADLADLTALLAVESDGQPVSIPPIVADVGGTIVDLEREDFANTGVANAWVRIRLPVAAVQAGTEVVLRAPDGTAFTVYEPRLELTHRAGSTADRVWVRDHGTPGPALVAPQLTVSREGRAISSGDAVRRGPLDVVVRTQPRAAQARGEAAGWVALRLTLDDRRILELPTAVDGPAIAGEYHLTIDTSALPPGYQPLVAELIADRPGLPRASSRFTLRLDT